MHKKADHAQDVGALSKSMLIVMALTVVGKVSGFVREIFMSRQYGITAVADAINTALNVPCFFLSAIVIALAATFIPVYSGRLQHSPGEANRFTNNLLTLGGVFTIVVLLLTYVFIEPLITGFLLKHHGRDTQEIAVRLSKWMMPMGLFMFLARMASAHLQANFRFTIPALSQICYNIVLIGAILVAGKLDVTYIAMGAVLGWVLQFIVQAPSMRRAGLSYRPVWDCKEPGLRQVLVLMIPVLIAGVFDTLYVGFDKSIASQVSGDISSLDYADRLTAMVSAILPVTIATVLYPSLVRHVGEPGKMSQDISFGVNVNLFISIPATIALLLLCRPITRLVYERGSFTPENTLSVAPLLACYAAGIFGVGLRELCNRCFFAYKDVKIPTAVGVGVILLKIGLNYILYPLWGAPGLAVATSFSWLLSGFALLFLLHLRQRVVGWRAILACLWKVAAATAAMSAALL
ncbi:MAG: murein biosynthesis integral membrane protein MurJ, partial [Firmicutes bacterium]|nr:murein biosynthesis integral membrane protein MurJ [Bacillota bacterium]